MAVLLPPSQEEVRLAREHNVVSDKEQQRQPSDALWRHPLLVKDRHPLLVKDKVGHWPGTYHSMVPIHPEYLLGNDPGSALSVSRFPQGFSRLLDDRVIGAAVSVEVMHGGG